MALALRSQFIFLENDSQLSTIFSILLKHSRQDAFNSKDNNNIIRFFYKKWLATLQVVFNRSVPPKLAKAGIFYNADPNGDDIFIVWYGLHSPLFM